MSIQQAVLDEIERSRTQLHQMVDSHMDALVLRMTVGDLTAYLQDTGARVLPLSSAAAQCKGTKPVAIVLPSGERVETSTWKKAAAAILRDCDSDLQRHNLLMELRGQVPGNIRQLLSETSDGMSAPLKINDGLYLEIRHASSTGEPRAEGPALGRLRLRRRGCALLGSQAGGRHGRRARSG